MCKIFLLTNALSFTKRLLRTTSPVKCPLCSIFCTFQWSRPTWWKSCVHTRPSVPEGVAPHSCSSLPAPTAMQGLPTDRPSPCKQHHCTDVKVHCCLLFCFSSSKLPFFTCIWSVTQSNYLKCTWTFPASQALSLKCRCSVWFFWGVLSFKFT